MKNYKEVMTEAKRDLPRLSDTDIIKSIESLIDKKVIWVETVSDKWFVLKWNKTVNSMFLVNDPKEIVKKWQDGIAGMMDVKNGKGFPITVWTGVPKELKTILQAAQEELKNRKFDKGNKNK